MTHAHAPAPAWIVWTMFVGAQAVYWWSKASLSKRSSLSGVRTVRQWFALQAPILGIRFLLATAGFWWWFDDPELVDRLFDSAGGALPAGTLKTVVEAISFPLNPGTAVLYALAVDSGLDKLIAFASRWLPKLQRALPPVDGEEKAQG